MPVDQELLQTLLKRPAQPIGTPIPLPTEDKNPTAAKTAFEGGMDALLGLIGVGPETKANLSGQLAMAGVPLVGGIKGIPGMFSRLTRAAEEMPDKLTAAAAKNYLMQRAGKEEMGYRSVLTTLEGKNPMEKVQKSDLLDHLAKNPLDVEVKELGKPMEGRLAELNRLLQDPNHNWTAQNAAEYTSLGGREDMIPNYYPMDRNTKYSQYTLPGGQNYRETLIKLPEKPENPDSIADWFYKHYGYEPHGNQLDPTSEAGRAVVSSYKQANTPNFQSNHFDDPNILVHVRHNEREISNPLKATPEDIKAYADLNGIKGDLGNDDPLVRSLVEQHLKDFGIDENPSKGRFLEEVQSDWHEQGRDKGYKKPGGNPAAKVEALRAQKQALWDQIKPLQEQERGLIDRGEPRVQISRQLGELEDQYDQVRRQIDQVANEYDTLVPDAPFKESWPDLALKQQLLDVADKPDLEWLGWTPGEVQNKRYDLSQVVHRIDYDPATGHLHAVGPEGETVISEGDVTPSKLQEYIGKDATTRLMQSEPVVPYTGATPIHRLSGEQLQVGGEGMTKFYDERLPNTMNKLLKPFGGKVEQAQIPAGMTSPTGSPYQYRLPNGEVYRNTPRATPLPEGSVREPNPEYKPAQQKMIQAWIARLSPEMKERIKKEGLPLLMALLARQQMGGQDAQQQPAR